MKHKMVSLLAGICLTVALYFAGCGPAAEIPKSTANIPIGANIKLRDQEFEKQITRDWRVRVRVVNNAIQITSLTTPPKAQNWQIYSREADQTKSGAFNGNLIDKAYAQSDAAVLPQPDCSECKEVKDPNGTDTIIKIKWVEIPLEGAGGTVSICTQIVVDSCDQK